MNTAEVMKERARLEKIVTEAETAQRKITLINRLIAVYGEDEDA